MWPLDITNGGKCRPVPKFPKYDQGLGGEGTDIGTLNLGHKFPFSGSVLTSNGH